MKVKKVNIIGGEAAIPRSIVDEIKSLNISVYRISGSSREDTAIAVAKAFNPNHSSIVVANGWKYADAVVGGYFAAKENSVLLLTTTDKVSKPLFDYFSENKVKTFILGGNTVVGPSVADSIAANLRLKVDPSAVSNETQLIQALKNPKIATIQIKQNIVLKDEIVIDRPVIIEGNNKIITGASNDWYDEDTWYNAIAVLSNKVIINNLTIQKGDSNNLYFEDVVGCEVNNVTLKDAGVSGLYISSSEVKTSNIKTINNYWQGIGVSKDFDRNPKLTVTNSHTHSSYKEYPGDFTPAIVIFDRLINDGWVNAKGYIEEKLQGDETHFGDLQYCFYDPKEYPK